METMEATLNCFDKFPDKPSYTKPEFKEITKIAKEEAENVFILGTTSNLKKVTELFNSTGKVPKRELLRVGFSLIRGMTPQSIKYSMQEKTFNTIPLDIPEKITDSGEYRILEKIGNGGINTVYFLGTENNSYAIGLKRDAFESTSSALKFAQFQQKEHAYFSELFKDVPNLIPKESNLVYENHAKKPSVMFVREFVPGPMRDIFTIEPEELETIIKSNNEFSDQMIKFATISMENKDFLIESGFDVLGLNNVVVSGEAGNEKLVLLETHTCLNMDSGCRNRISQKLDYIKQFVENATTPSYNGEAAS